MKPFRRRRRASIAAIAVTVAVIAASCGSDDETSSEASSDTSGDTVAATDETGSVDPAPAATSETTPAGTDAPGDRDTLTVYSGRGEDLVGPLIEMFEAETGIPAEVRYGDSAEMLLLIQEEGDNSPADVFFSQGAGFLGQLSTDGDLVELPTDVLDLVPEALRSPAGDWVGTSARARTVVYNTDELSEADLPDTILGYTEPEWEGRIGYAPTNASFQDFVTALRAIEGEGAAKQWLEGLIANGAVPYENNTAVVEAVGAGEVSVGFVNHYYLYRFLAEDPAFPAANKFSTGADPGALVNIAGAGVLATSDEQDEALEFVEFLLSPAAQEYFATETFEIPLVAGTEVAADLPAIDTIGLEGFDLNELLDLQGTVDLLTEVGAL
jgi:iron(III) transport system substrate-binding protein